MDPSIGLAGIHPAGDGAQQTDYLINFVATAAQLSNFDAAFWGRRFFSVHPDKFDFLNFVHVAGTRGNRYHFAVRNDVRGIGLNVFNNTATYGSASQLKGCRVFPLADSFDAGEAAFSQEMGHQWIIF